MPLTPGEFAYMSHLLPEYMNLEMGPAQTALRALGDPPLVYLFDYAWIMEAYTNERTDREPDGEGAWLNGKPPGPTPPIPWTIQEEVRARNRALEPEVREWRRRRKAGDP